MSDPTIQCLDGFVLVDSLPRGAVHLDTVERVAECDGQAYVVEFDKYGYSESRPGIGCDESLVMFHPTNCETVPVEAVELAMEYLD